LNSARKFSDEFVPARGDGSKVFDLVEETLDEVAFAVERRIHAVLFEVQPGLDDNVDKIQTS
jgi:hypothetical protein